MKIDLNDFFRQVTLRICGSLDIQTALEKSFQYVENFIPVTAMAMVLYDSDLNVAHIIASAGSDMDNLGKTVVLPSEGTKIRAAQWASMAPVKITNCPDLNPDMRMVFRQYGLDLNVSLLDVRLELEGNRIGVLSLRAKGNHRYTNEHASVLQAVHEPFAIAMANALKHREVSRLKDILADDNRYLHQRLREMTGSNIVGADFGLKDVMRSLQQVAPLDSPVLLYGETGVGKEVIANAIHYSSSRREGPMIRVNCGAIPETLIDSELFGHEKGAFTGALSERRGRFERAHKGTIFLDEIGELPPNVQTRLLNVLQNREIERVGGTRTIPVDIRIISATHRNLGEMVKSRHFREDLLFRLNVFPITIPPLRQRKEDIPALVHHFIEEKSKELKLQVRPRLMPGALEKLNAYDWPGNVRELQNIVERALIRHRDGMLSFDVSPEDPPPVPVLKDRTGTTGTLHSYDEMCRYHIRRALNISKGKINGPGGAAEILDIHPNTLRKRMTNLGISYGRKIKFQGDEFN